MGHGGSSGDRAPVLLMVTAMRLIFFILAVGGENTVTYQALLNHREYEPRDQSDGLNPSISMSSWLVFSQ